MERRFPLILALALALTGPFAAPSWAQGPVGSQFQVNSYTTNLQSSPEVAHTPDGGFVVT